MVVVVAVVVVVVVAVVEVEMVGLGDECTLQDAIADVCTLQMLTIACTSRSVIFHITDCSSAGRPTARQATFMARHPAGHLSAGSPRPAEP